MGTYHHGADESAGQNLVRHFDTQCVELVGPAWMIAIRAARVGPGTPK
jgi:hypothetical protein